MKYENRESILKQFQDAKSSHKVTSKYQVWQEGFHPQEMENEEVLKQKIEYIHFNPVRKWFIKNPEEWKYSSATDYYTNREGLLEIKRIV